MLHTPFCDLNSAHRNVSLLTKDRQKMILFICLLVLFVFLSVTIPVRDKVPILWSMGQWGIGHGVWGEGNGEWDI